MEYQSEILLRVDKLGQILQRILIKQIRINHTLEYCLFFKRIQLNSQGMVINILCNGFRQEFEKNITNLGEYKEKYKDYIEIAGFVGQQIPQIIQLSANDTLIVFKNEIHTQIYHYNNLMRKNSNLKILETLELECRIQKDEYKDNIFIILQKQPQNQLQLSEYQKIKNKFKRIQTISLELWNNSLQLQLFTKYNDNRYILMTESLLLIISINKDNNNCTTIRKIELPLLKGIITLYFYPQFQSENIMYLLIQADNVTLQISSHQKLINNEIDLNFTITLNQIKILTLETIRKAFLLDLVAALPSITEFSLWPYNDFEAIKHLILQNLPIKGIGEMITCSMIYSLKYKPALILGILKYSEYYCFFISFPFIQLVRTIYEWLPGYRNLGHHNLNAELSDEEIVWNQINKLCQL